MNPYISEESQARYQEWVGAAIGERLIVWRMRVKAQATPVKANQ